MTTTETAHPAGEYLNDHVTPSVFTEDMAFQDGTRGAGDWLQLMNMPAAERRRLPGLELRDRQRSMLLVAGSSNCPKTAGSNLMLKWLHAAFGDPVEFLQVYVCEAHSGQRYDQVDHQEERRCHAQALTERDDLSWTIAVDDPSLTIHRVLDGKPNAAWLKDGGGDLVSRALWAIDKRGMTHQLNAAARGERPDMRDRDLGGYVADARRAVQERVALPPGYDLQWSGQFEYLEYADARLRLVVPATLALIFLLLYPNFGRLTETLIVMLSVPFALVGGLWLMLWLGHSMSVAVAFGFIALAGVAAQTGVVMLVYLDHAWDELRARRAAAGRTVTRADLLAAVMEGAVERVRPKVMTVAAIAASLLPLLWADGTGSEVMQRIAVPMIGGMASSVVLTLVVIPALFAMAKGFRLPRESSAGGAIPTAQTARETT